MVNNQKKENEGPTRTEEVQLLFVRNENAIRAFIRALQPSLSDACLLYTSDAADE